MVLVDFGGSKLISEEEKQLPDVKRSTAAMSMSYDFTKRKSTGASFVGTEEYVSPEILQGKESDYSSDLWSLGVMIY